MCPSVSEPTPLVFTGGHRLIGPWFPMIGVAPTPQLSLRGGSNANKWIVYNGDPIKMDDFGATPISGNLMKPPYFGSKNALMLCSDQYDGAI